MRRYLEKIPFKIHAMSFLVYEFGIHIQNFITIKFNICVSISYCCMPIIIFLKNNKILKNPPL